MKHEIVIFRSKRNIKGLLVKICVEKKDSSVCGKTVVFYVINIV
jgi:hypothetical protein